MLADKQIDRNKLPYPMREETQLRNQEEFDEIPSSRPTQEVNERLHADNSRAKWKRVVYVVQDLPLY